MKSRHAFLSLLLCALALVLSAPVGASLLDKVTGQSKPLRVEQAFPFSVEMAGPQEIKARFETRDGYYLYRDKLRFELTDSPIPIAQVNIPAGEVKDDPYFGRLEVLYGPVEIGLILEQPLSGAATLRVGYQGCADAGLCYPPETLDYPLQGMASATASGAPAASTPVTPAAPAATMEERLARSLQGYLDGGSWMAALALTFGLGILVSFMGCVYPMVPILSGLIAGDRHRASGTRATLLALTYVQASALVYAGIGAIAGLSGRAVQADFQNPWALGGFALLLVLLSLAMFGVYNLQLPAAWQTRVDQLARRQRGGSFVGVAVMGGLSSLIIGACAGPAIVALLTFATTTGNGLTGAALMFAFANGLGFPLVVAGSALGKWLPRAGHWMNTIKRLCGVAFLAAAILLLERLLPAHISLALWGALLLGCAVYVGAFDRLAADADGPMRARKFLGVLLLLWGSTQVVGAAAGGHDFWKPLAGLRAGPAAASSEQGLGFQAVTSVAELDTMLTRAKTAAQPVMLDVYADWCVYCVQLERGTFPAPEVQAALSGSLLLRVDVTAMSDDDKALLERLGVFLPPAVIFYGADGEERRELRVTGFMEPGLFASRARQALQGGQAL